MSNDVKLVNLAVWNQDKVSSHFGVQVSTYEHLCQIEAQRRECLSSVIRDVPENVVPKILEAIYNETDVELMYEIF